MAGNDVYLFSVPSDSDRDDVRLGQQAVASGTLVVTLANATIAATAIVEISGALSVTLDNATLSAEATMEAPVERTGAVGGGAKFGGAKIRAREIDQYVADAYAALLAKRAVPPTPKQIQAEIIAAPADADDPVVPHVSLAAIRAAVIRLESELAAMRQAAYDEQDDEDAYMALAA